MHRQLLRSRAGCNRCKLRRKKCDERKPVCSSCERLGLICTWGSEPQATTSRDVPGITPIDGISTPNAAIQRLPLSRNVSTGVPVFQNQTQFDLILRFPDIFITSLAPTASAEYKDVSTVMNIALHDEGVRNAMSAVSGWISYLQTEEPFFEQTSLENYQRAVINLRHKVLQDTDDIDKIPLMLTAVYLGAVEANGLGNPQLAAYHYAAAARLWSRMSYDDLADGRRKTLHKIVAEIWLCFLANLVMFLTLAELNRVLASIDWSALKIAFQQSTDSTSPACAISPHIALDHGLFRLIIQITHFGRLTYEDQANYTLRQQQLETWFAEVTQIESSLATAFVGVPKDIADTYRVISHLYVHTLRICLNKVAVPGSCSLSAEIRSSFHQALPLLASLESKSNLTSAVGWPLRILLCAACKEEDFQSIVTKCEEAEFDGGTYRVNARVTRVVRRLRKNQPCSGNHTCTRSHDGLEILTLKDGIISLEDVDDNQVHTSISLPPQRPFTWLWQRI